MKLPHRDRAHVPMRKLTNYLLSPSHPVGRSKAPFFRGLGFNASDADALRAELLGWRLHKFFVGWTCSSWQIPTVIQPERSESCVHPRHYRAQTTNHKGSSDDGRIVR